MMDGMEALLRGAEGGTRSHFPFSAIVGQEQAKRALMACVVAPEATSLLIWGNAGTAKTSLAQSVVGIAPDVATRAGCPLHCAKGDDCPVCDGKGEESPSRPPVANLSPGLAESSLHNLEQGKDLRGNILATANNGYLIVDGVDSYPKKVMEGLVKLSKGGKSAKWKPRFMLIGTYDAGMADPPATVSLFDLCVNTAVIDDLEGRIEITRRGMTYLRDPPGFSAMFVREELKAVERVRKARDAYTKTFLTEKAREILRKSAPEGRLEATRAAAKALGALSGKRWATPEEIEEALILTVGSREALQGEVVRL